VRSYGDAGFSLFLRKAFIKAMGYSDDALERRHNEYVQRLQSCHGNVPDLIESVKRGVMLAGGLPMVFPTISIGESFAYPTSMFLAQSNGDGYRGDDPSAADGLGGSNWRLRQDAPCPGHGRRQYRSTDNRHPDGADGRRPSQGRSPGSLHRLSTILRPASRRHNRRSRIRTDQRSPRLFCRHLHGDGEHHGLHRRSLGSGAADERRGTRHQADRRRIAEASGKRAAEIAISGAPTPSELITQASVRNP
jgi:dihydroxy-acid dehydratase